jgi:mevalonate kinase
MESFFHGKSSGLDPLNSYLSLPILISAQDQIEATGIPSQNTTGKGTVFLLDSGVVGETAPMVQIFMQKMKQEGFRSMLKDQFIKHTDHCVDAFLAGDVHTLFKSTKQLSKVVLSHFKPMIPKKFHQLWASGIESNDYYLKLCGSGGGGYILGFTEDIDKARKALSDYKLEVVYNF